MRRRIGAFDSLCHWEQWGDLCSLWSVRWAHWALRLELRMADPIQGNFWRTYINERVHFTKQVHYCYCTLLDVILHSLVKDVKRHSNEVSED